MNRTIQLVPALLLFTLGAVAFASEAVVERECDIFTLLPPDNGSGPLWSAGCSQIARLGDEVYVSVMETGEDVPLLCNTRWRFLRLGESGWETVAEPEGYRQREPASLAVLPPRQLALYVNDSLEPPGVKYGPCLPHLLSFTVTEDGVEEKAFLPQWSKQHHFTDHSYRGYAADAKKGLLLMLNIDATTSVQQACLMDQQGKTLALGFLEFPIRACYPQVALQDKAVHVLAIGDIVEPVEAWRTYKFQQTEQQWDYVFRRLFYAFTPDLTRENFGEALEIDSVDDTCGYMRNQDLWISPDGEAWILYTRREVQNELMRDRFFPDKSILDSLWLARIREGKIVHKEMLIAGTEESQATQARFHESDNGALYAILFVSGTQGGNKALRLNPEDTDKTLIDLPLEEALSAYCLAGTRFGNAPSSIVDFYGTPGENRYRYAGVRIRE
ncbi:MAG: hypothetical protein GX130_06440 [Candidatus Hydrogenedens sp.]|nr:hypothetical protein [Candidatus Hydrogenedens sp.]